MSHYLITIILAPVLLIQGKWVKKRTIILPEPSGARSGAKGTGKELRLLILGDSAAAGVGASHQDNALLGQLVNKLAGDFCVSWRLVATTGASTEDTLQMLDKLEHDQFDIVLTSLGVNDVTSGVSLPKWLQQQNTLQEKCFNSFNTQLIILTAVPPMGKFPALPQPLRWYLGRRSDQLNQALHKQASYNKKTHYLSIGSMDDIKVMASDGFHPGEEVYQQWALKAAEKIKSVFLKEN